MTTLSLECPECRKVEALLNIDIKRLLDDLAKYKQKELTEQQKQYLCLSMLGDEPIDIARKENYQHYYNKRKRENKDLSSQEIDELVEQDIKNRARNISNFLSETVNQYIIDLITKLDDSLSFNTRPPWLWIICFLIDNGYKKNTPPIQKSNMKQIVIELKDETDFKKMVEFIEFMKQKFGHNALKFQTIESKEDEENERQN